MATSDRLYELTCDCRDLETRLDRLTREVLHKDEQLATLKKQSNALLNELSIAYDSEQLPTELKARVEELQILLT